jgi:diguanylate cyclase (GGDEF)-like protein
MNYKDIGYILFAVIIAVVYFSIATYAWKHRSVPGATALAILMLAAGGYAAPYLLQLASPDLKTALFWYNLSLPGASILGPVWLIFSIQYTQQQESPTRRVLLLGLVPAITCLVAWTAPFHNLYGTHFRFDPASSWPVLEWDFGLFYWINFAYAYLCTTVGILLLVRTALKRLRFFTQQTVCLLVGILVPIALNVIFVMGYTSIPKMDIAPFSFLITGVAWSLAIFRFRFLDIVPVARERLFDTMPIGVVVLDDQSRMVDINPAAAGMLSVAPAQVVGQSLLAVLPGFYPGLSGDAQEEICLPQAGGGRYLDVHSTPLLNHRGELTGTLILLQDVTRRKMAEISERDQRILAEVLRDIASDINGTLRLEEVLDHILENLARIVPYDTAHILLVDRRDRCITLVRSRGAHPTPPDPECFAVLLDQVLNMSHPFLLDGSALRSFLQKDNGREWVLSSVVTPVLIRRELAGILIIDSAVPNNFSHLHLQSMNTFANQAAIAIENARLYARLEERAVQDDLTGILNRRGFFEGAQLELDRASSFPGSVGVILFDLDHYKQINDTYGHAVGDQVLRAVIALCRSSIRSVDVIGRYGGDEFMIFLPDCELHTAYQVALRLCKCIETNQILVGSEKLNVTISAGVAAGEAAVQTLDALFHRADQALYTAKQAGRNCVCQDEGASLENSAPF